jgi:hypothetical protein
MKEQQSEDLYLTRGKIVTSPIGKQLTNLPLTQYKLQLTHKNTIAYVMYCKVPRTSTIS